MALLQLNEKVIPYVEFYGRKTYQMPLLIKQGRIPMSVLGLMQRRLEVTNLDNLELKSAWHDNYFDTGDGCSRDTNGNIKVVYDSKDLKQLNYQTKLVDIGMALEADQYKALEGSEFKAKDLDKYTGKPLTKNEVLENPIWLALARDTNLLKEYADMVFSEIKSRFNYDNKNMGLYVPLVAKQPIMQLWTVYSSFEGKSNANSSNNLDGDKGRLVGVVPEVLGKRI